MYILFYGLGALMVFLMWMGYALRGEKEHRWVPLALWLMGGVGGIILFLVSIGFSVGQANNG